MQKKYFPNVFYKLLISLVLKSSNFPVFLEKNFNNNVINDARRYFCADFDALFCYPLP